MTISGSRFHANSSNSGSAILNAGATITANNDWWGADAFPNAAGTDTVVTTSGTTTITSRLALTLTPAATRIGANSSTTLTANVVSTTNTSTPIAGTALDGLAFTFAPGTLGSVSPTSVVIAGGTASSTFTAGSAAGTTSPSITLDNGTKTTSITVIGAPTANSQSVSTAFNTARAITLTGSDPNTPALALTYTVTTAPTHGTLSGTAPNLTYTPTAGYHGADSFTFTASNGTATSNTATVTITVAAGTPTANSQTDAVAHDGAGSAIILTDSDPDVPPLTQIYTIATQPAHGTLTNFNSSTGAVTYVPAAGYHGTDSFTFTASNGANTSAPATVTLTVAAGTPTAASQTAAVAHDSSGTPITLTDTDDDSPVLAQTYTFTQPAHGTVKVSGSVGSPTVTYVPAAGYHGTDSFTFTASNGANTSAPATVTLTVATGTPIANAQSVSTNQGSAVAITLTAADDDTPALTQSYSFTQPAHGTVTVSGSAGSPTVVYTPAAGYHGTDSFTFAASNGTNTSAPATVSINVAPVVATVSGTVGITWGPAGAASLQTNADGLRLLPAGRNTDLPWLGIKTLSITLSQAATLSAGDVSVTGVNLANYGPVTISGSGTNYTIALAQPINAADRVTVTIANTGISTFTRRLDVLPADFNDDGAVTMQDAIGIRNEYLGFAGAMPTVFGDINGDYAVDVNDYNLTRRLIGTVLP